MSNFFSEEDRAERKRRATSTTQSPGITKLVVESMLRDVKASYRTNTSSPMTIEFTEHFCRDAAESGGLLDEWCSYDPDWSIRLWAREIEAMARTLSGLGDNLTVDYKNQEEWSSGGGRDGGVRPRKIIMKVEVQD